MYLYVQVHRDISITFPTCSYNSAPTEHKIKEHDVYLVNATTCLITELIFPN